MRRDFPCKLQGRIQDFLREGAGQADMPDVQSQKSAEDLICMHRQLGELARHNWLTDCFNRIFDCSIRVSQSFCNLGGRVQQAFGRAWALPGPPLVTPLPTLLDPPLNLFLFVRCSYKGNWPKAA